MMNFLKNIFAGEKRNYASSEVIRSGMPAPVFTSWTVRKAVKSGYKASGWVYRCVYLISKSVSAVPWHVRNAEDEIIDSHPLTLLFANPNPHISRQDMFELMTAWLELTGNSYLKKVSSGKYTAELWPVSPDRIHPIPAKSVDEWLSGYALDEAKSATFQPEEIIHHKFMNPENPIIGISPLEIAGKAVDTDTSQQAFNTASAQNRGVLDGVFTFQRDFRNQDETDAIAAKIQEKYKKKRGFLVLGSNAKYERLSLSPVEMDFTNSRKFNREEICVIFGVPLPLIASDVMTYSNYQTAEEILWSLTIMPLLEDIADGFNFSLSGELGKGEKIVPDISNVPAIRRLLLSKAETAEKLFDMGVPFENLNKIFRFGVDAFPGWDRTFAKNVDRTAKEARDQNLKKDAVIPTQTHECRAGNAEISKEVEELSEGKIRILFAGLLKKQKKKVFSALEKGEIHRISEIITEDTEDWTDAMQKAYLSAALHFAEKVTVELRGELREAQSLEELLTEYFDQETLLLTEKSRIAEATVSAVLEQVKAGLALGASTKEIQQCLLDCGIFENDRALRLARTLTGTASSIGQYQGAKTSGAKWKTWDAAGFGSRKEHAERDGERVPIDGRFSAKFGASTGPRYPLDPTMPVADRVNCRCSMRFSVD